MVTIIKKGLITQKNKVDKALETIERNAKLESKLVDDLLDVSRILANKLILKKNQSI